MAILFHFRYAAFLLGILFPLELISSPFPIDNTVSQEDSIQVNELTCDPLEAEGTSLLCVPPDGNSANCSQPSIPGTMASYSCRNSRKEIYSGFLTCTDSGTWITSLLRANNSLCNLDASIINFEVPDVAIASDIPDFTTPLPNQNLLQPDATSLKEYERVALQLHNVFRTNHGVPDVIMTRQLNDLAQHLVNSITSSGDIQDLEASLKLTPLHRTMNLEMNWYFQVPQSPSNSEAVSNAVQSWYSGFRKYDWDHVERILDEGDALSFARVIWKTTKLIGVGVATSHDITFVACVYTPGRNVLSTEPVQEFALNVPRFLIGSIN